MRARFVVAVVALASLVVMALPPATPAGASTRPTGFNLSSKWFRSGGWKWKIVAAIGTDRVLSLNVIAKQRLHEGSDPLQQHVWTFRLPSDDLITGHADLMPTTLDTGTDLGHFGAIDVSLQPGTTLKSRAETCPKTGAILARIRSRTGTFAGTFDFTPGPGMPADVAPASFAGTIEKITQTDNTCGQTTATACPVGSSVVVFQADAQVGTLFADDTPRRSSISFDAAHTFARGTRDDSMLANVPPGAVVVTHDLAVVHSKPFASWADGTIRLTLGAAHVHHLSPTCTRTSYNVASQSGGITVHFATGDVSYDTPFKLGVAVTVVTHT